MLDLEQYQVGRGRLQSLYVIPEYINVEQEQQLLREIEASKQAWKPVSGRRLQNWGGVVHKKGLIPAPLPSWLQRLTHRISAETGIYGTPALAAGAAGAGAASTAQPSSAQQAEAAEQQCLDANHVLVNSYQPGEGILPHEDGPLYWPAVAILSLGSSAVLRFAEKRQPEPESMAGAAAEPAPGSGGEACVARPNQQPSSAGGGSAGCGDCPTAPGTPLAQLVASVICPPRSLLIFRDRAYTACLHGVMETTEEPIDASVVNAEQCGATLGTRLPRTGERVSLTVRRVLHTYSLGVMGMGRR